MGNAGGAPRENGSSMVETGSIAVT